MLLHLVLRLQHPIQQPNGKADTGTYLLDTIQIPLPPLLLPAVRCLCCSESVHTQHIDTHAMDPEEIPKDNEFYVSELTISS